MTTPAIETWMSVESGGVEAYTPLGDVYSSVPAPTAGKSAARAACATNSSTTQHKTHAIQTAVASSDSRGERAATLVIAVSPLLVGGEISRRG